MSCISCRTPMDIDGARIKSSQSSSPSSSDERLGLISGEIYRTTCRNKRYAGSVTQGRFPLIPGV